jgi:hypothetical protein
MALSYMGGGGQRMTISRPAEAKLVITLIQKQNPKK